MIAVVESVAGVLGVSWALDHCWRWPLLVPTEGRITPDTFVRYVHAFFAFAGGSGNCTIGIDDRLSEKFRTLLRPDALVKLK